MSDPFLELILYGPFVTDFGHIVLQRPTIPLGHEHAHLVPTLLLIILNFIEVILN